MRIFTCLTICCILSLAVSAQQKGQVLLGGTIGFSDYKSNEFGNENNQKNFSFYPSVGKFYANNKLAGVTLSYFHSKFRDSLSRNSIGLGVFMRQFQPLGKSIYLFAEENLRGYTSRSNDNWASAANVKTKGRGVSLNLFPGVAYAVNKHLWLEVSLMNLVSVGYNKETFENNLLPEPNARTSSTFAVSTGLNDFNINSVFLGVRWLIGKK